MIITAHPKCVWCRGSQAGTMEQEIIYHMIKSLDEPWECINCRRHI